MKYSASLSGVDELALMLLDVLSSVEQISICIAYELDGQRVDSFPGDSFLLEKCRPIYETVPGWQADLARVRRYDDLPLAARQYVDRLRELLKLPISIVSVGPDREQTICVEREGRGLGREG